LAFADSNHKTPKRRDRDLESESEERVGGWVVVSTDPFFFFLRFYEIQWEEEQQQTQSEWRSKSRPN
jgi:hypothetical protein